MFIELLVDPSTDESAATQETRGELDEGKRSEEDTRTGGGGAAVEEQQAPVHDDDDNSPWYYGKARDEFNRRRGIDVPPDDEDPVQVRTAFSSFSSRLRTPIH